MSRLINKIFNNISLKPPQNPVNGDGLLYINDVPLLIYKDSGWFINDAAITESTGGTVLAINGPGAGQGLPRKVYHIDEVKRLATGSFKKYNRTLNTTVDIPNIDYPNRHSKYMNMGIIFNIPNYTLQKGDIIFATDKSLFKKFDNESINHYIVGWYEEQSQHKTT